MEIDARFSLAPEDLQKPRTPFELRDFIEEIRRATKMDDALRHAAIQKKGLFKQLTEEIMPIKCYALSQYPDNDVRVSPVLGNQGYDAEIHDFMGNLVERIEVTIPHDGESERKDAKLTVTRGYGQFHLFEPGGEARLLRRRLLEAARSKAMKDYTDCTLLFVLALLPPIDSPITQSADMKEVAAIEASLIAIAFRAKKVALLLPGGQVRTIQSEDSSLQGIGK